jgi:hypothetical protein
MIYGQVVHVGMILGPARQGPHYLLGAYHGHKHTLTSSMHWYKVTYMFFFFLKSKFAYACMAHLKSLENSSRQRF